MPTDVENQVLALLAKEWDYSGPPGIMDVSDIVAALPMAPSETLKAVKRLFTDGLIDMNELKTSAFLTPDGYAMGEPSGSPGSGRPIKWQTGRERGEAASVERDDPHRRGGES